MPGLGLAQRFYDEVIGPRLAGTPHAAALLGDGSEVLGYDDEVSTDHDFGPRAQIFLASGADPELVRARLADLSDTVDGHAVDGHAGAAVEVTTAPAFFTARIGVDPAAGMALADWLLTPTQRLATLTAGAVFHDPEGELAGRRAALAWYPDDVWRYILAAAWVRIGQEAPFVGRTGGRGDELGSRVVAARLVRELVRLAFLVERRWAPYSKWLGRAFGELGLSATVGPHLSIALGAVRWRDREADLCAAAGLLGAATNRLGLAAPVDPAPRRFYTRDIQVVDAEGFAEALTAAIVDPEVRALLDRLDRLGRRADGRMGSIPGAVDQAVDSVDILTHVGRCRAAASMLGLEPTTL